MAPSKTMRPARRPTVRGKKARASSRSCRLATRVSSRSSASSTSSASTSRPRSRSTEATGSSARSARGSWNSARAMATRCCWPPESVSVRWKSFSPMPTRSRMRCTRSRSAPWGQSVDTIPASRLRCPRRPATTFWATRRIGTSAWSWCTKPTRERTARRSAGARRASDRPETRTVPASGSRVPARSRSRVVLPAPLGPTSATFSPRPMERSIPCRAERPSKCTAAPLSSKWGSNEVASRRQRSMSIARIVSSIAA